MGDFSLKKINTPFWLFTTAIFILLIVPELIQDGMFTDGQLYASVAKNLANNKGTFWFPHFSKTTMSSFHEQPPLFFGIQALFFKIFGDTIYTERICSFIMACITAFFIHKIWKRIQSNDNEVKQLSWLPIFFWIIIPVCFWAYINNVEETIMGVFDVIAVYFIVSGLQANKNSFYYFFIAGFAIFLASLCKGFQGLFPVVAIGCYWLTNKNMSFKKALSYSLILFLVPLLIYGLLIMNDSIYQSFSNYLSKRIINTFNNVGATTDNHFELLWRLFTELIPVLAICLIIFLIARFKKIDFNELKLNRRMASFFILIGISGSFPLIVTLEQRGFYLVTTLPYFAIGISIMIAPMVYTLIKRVNTRAFKTFNYFSIFILCFSILFSVSKIGGTKRDKDVLHDVYMIGKVVSTDATISVDPALWNEWALQSYFVRHFNISLDPTNHLEYFLSEKGKNNFPDEEYTKLKAATVKYDIYQKQSIVK